MQIKVRLIGALRIDRFKEQIVEYPDGSTVGEIAIRLQISDRSVGIALINGFHAGPDRTLSDGDTLSLLPILGGG
jgi:molybdopterin converting factor small subunit